jgi:N-acetylglucosamine kinase-like BadF-type ATPase
VSSDATFCVDAGGSNTVVRTRRLDGSERTWRTPSCAIASVGEVGAFAQLRSILGRVERELEGQGPLRGCVASSSFPVAGEARPPGTLVEAIAGSGFAGRVYLVNDVVPLLWDKALGNAGLVVNSGTGSVVLGRRADGHLVKLGGHEHILSDGGSAYTLGRQALRATVLAADRMGAKTDLEPQAEAFYGMPVRELGRRLAEMARARQEVARFAPVVTELAASGDEVAREITVAEAGDLAVTAVEGHRRLALDDSETVAFSGGVMHGSPFFRALVAQSMQDSGVRAEPVLLNSLDAALAFADRDGAGASDLVEAMGGLLITVG